MQARTAPKRGKRLVKLIYKGKTNKASFPLCGEASCAVKRKPSSSNCSAILAVETKNERVRTIKAYEKQRSILHSAIFR